MSDWIYALRLYLWALNKIRYLHGDADDLIIRNRVCPMIIHTIWLFITSFFTSIYSNNLFFFNMSHYFLNEDFNPLTTLSNAFSFSFLSKNDKFSSWETFLLKIVLFLWSIQFKVQLKLDQLFISLVLYTIFCLSFENYITF